AIEAVRLATVPPLRGDVKTPRLPVREGEVVDDVPAVLIGERERARGVEVAPCRLHRLRGDRLRGVAVQGIDDLVVAEKEYAVVQAADGVCRRAALLDHGRGIELERGVFGG